MKDVSEFVPGKRYVRIGDPPVMFVGFDRDGDLVFDTDYGLDVAGKQAVNLFEAVPDPISGTLFINVHVGPRGGRLASVLHTREQVEAHALNNRDKKHVACIEVHYTEGDGL